jgi:ribosomal protein S18 acetylase RimI-like enzyme
VGSALVRIAIERCEAIDSWESLRLFANNDAVAFYEALGFEIKVLTKPAPPGSTAMFLYKEPRT